MLRSHLLLALRVLLRRPFFTFVSLFAISITLVVLAVATAVLDHTFAPKSPEVNQERTLGLYHMFMHGESHVWESTPGYAFLDRYVRTLPDVERVTLFTQTSTLASYQTGEKTELHAKRTDGEFWRVFEFDFVEGEPFTPADEELGNAVAIINVSTRDRLFAGRSALGESLTLDGQRFRVAGVVENVSSLRPDPFADVWVPISTAKSSLYREGFFGEFNAVVMARDKADLPRIKSEFAAVLPEVELPDERKYTALNGGLDSRFEWVSRDFFSEDYAESRPGRLLGWIVGMMFLFMLLPSVNLINVNISRIMERASEIGVRKAFGASSRALVGQFLLENLLLTGVGALLGLALSTLALRALSSTGFVPYADFVINARVFAYGLAITLFFGLLSGVYPAWKMSRLEPVDALRGRSM